MRAGACLSLTGRFAPFGRQAAEGLKLWADQDNVDLTVLDDESNIDVLKDRLPGLAEQVVLLFGPYSTVLMRAAGRIASQHDHLLFNHGGSGGRPGDAEQVVNVLTPARRYAAPFVELLGRLNRMPLFVATRRGAFGRDVVEGAVEAAKAAGLHVEVLDVENPPRGVWNLLSAGVYEDDVATVQAAQSMPTAPRLVCSVAAGVGDFARDVEESDGVLGVGQWALGVQADVDLGMDESAFLAEWRRRVGGEPDYPAVQAYAAGVIAATAARSAGSVDAGRLWRELVALDARTVFGRFRLDALTGEQIGHEAVLTRWRQGRQTLVPRT